LVWKDEKGPGVSVFVMEVLDPFEERSAVGLSKPGRGRK
jgi:hypothetical protein